MDLRTYLERTATSPADFASAIEVTPQALYRYLDGTRLPRRDVMERITLHTQGTVQPNDFYPTHGSAA